jgi:hypothetical protein
MGPKKEKIVLTEDQLDDEIVKATLRLNALKNIYVRRLEEVAESRAEEQELRERSKQLDDAFTESMRERFDIISDFTRQHKATEDELIARITVLDSIITDLRDQKELSLLALKETEKERDHYIAMKQREFEEQEKKMKEMEEEFAIMLNDTQNKMTERVEATMHMADEDDENDEERADE